MRNTEPFILTGQLHDTTILHAVEEAGFLPVHLPLIDTKLISIPNEQLQRVLSCEWLLFTSQTAVHAFFDQVKTKLSHQFAVVGTKTERALARYGYAASFIPSTFSADCFIQEWNAQFEADVSIGFIKGNLAKPIMEQQLHARVHSLIAYETVPVLENGLQITAHSANYERLTLVFASPSAVRAYQQAGLPVLSNAVFCAIGHITKAAMHEAGLPVHVMPQKYTIEDVLKARMNWKE